MAIQSFHRIWVEHGYFSVNKSVWTLFTGTYICTRCMNAKANTEAWSKCWKQLDVVSPNAWGKAVHLLSRILIIWNLAMCHISQAIMYISDDIWHMTWEWRGASTVGRWSAIEDARCESHVQSTHQAARRKEFNAETADWCDHAFRRSPKGFNSKQTNKKQNAITG